MKEKIRFSEDICLVMKDMQDDGWNVVGVLHNVEHGGYIIVPGRNIVTNAGDLYYAQSAVGEAPTDDFDGASSGLRLGTSNTAVGKTDTDVTTFGTDGDIGLTSGYPKTNDADADNTGAGTDIVTWKYDFGTGDANITGIQEGAIVDNKTTPTAALTHFLFAASFNKTSSNTLKVFVNHQFSGV